MREQGGPAMPLKVLVVDDDQMVLRAHMRVLELAGHLCFGAHSALGAMSILRRESIDVVVSDVRMPGEDGIALARAIQRNLPDLPLVMVTGIADFSSVNAARSAGAVGYLLKPVAAAELLAAVDRAISRRAPHAPTDDRSTPARSDNAAADRETTEPPRSEPAIDRLLHEMVRAGASDLYLSTGAPPLVRKDGEMMPLDPGAAPLAVDDVIRLVDPIVPNRNRCEFEQLADSDFAYEIAGLSRFRASIFMDRNGAGAVFRTMPTRIVSAEQLGLPAAVLELCALREGLVLVTGAAGSGKSTTLASLIDHINRSRADHIVTIEDPIEFVHENQRCLINQREVYTHTRSFQTALRVALRDDPDVVLIGEMRDVETIAIALEMAQTGHLVLARLHARTAASAVDRIIDQFPPNRQPQVRATLAESLKGVIAQALCRRIGGGRIAAMEILLVENAISKLIREGKTCEIASMMQTGQVADSVSLNDALCQLVRDGTVTAHEAYSRAIDKATFAAMLARLDIHV